MEDSLNNYKFVLKEIQIREYIRDELKTNRVICIGIKDTITGIIIPHPLSDFIRLKYEYKGRSLNSQTAPAYIVCRFFNFIYDQIEKKHLDFVLLKTVGISGLNLQHGSHFISYLTLKGLSRT